MSTALSSAAELTLQVVTFLQSEHAATRYPTIWTFVPTRQRWPGGPGLSTREAAEYLDGLPKPILVGALNHPGLLALWTPDALESTEREYVSRLVANQVAGFAEMLPQLDATLPDIVVFENQGTMTRVSTSTFSEWLTNFGLTWGWRLGLPTDGTHRARLLVLHGSGKWSPGDSCPRPESA